MTTSVNKIEGVSTPTIGPLMPTQQSFSSFCIEYTQLKELQLQVNTGKEKEKELVALIERSKDLLTQGRSRTS
jgi:hypothetical protein